MRYSVRIAKIIIQPSASSVSESETEIIKNKVGDHNYNDRQNSSSKNIQIDED